MCKLVLAAAVVSLVGCGVTMPGHGGGGARRRQGRQRRQRLGRQRLGRKRRPAVRADRPEHRRRRRRLHGRAGRLQRLRSVDESRRDRDRRQRQGRRLQRHDRREQPGVRLGVGGQQGPDRDRALDRDLRHALLQGRDDRGPVGHARAQRARQLRRPHAEGGRELRALVERRRRRRNGAGLRQPADRDRPQEHGNQPAAEPHGRRLVRPGGSDERARLHRGRPPAARAVERAVVLVQLPVLLGRVPELRLHDVQRRVPRDRAVVEDLPDADQHLVRHAACTRSR